MLRPHPTPFRLLVAGVTAALLAGLLGACSGTPDEAGAGPSPTPGTPATSTPAQESTTTAADPGRDLPDAPEPPRHRRGPAGQEQFARYVMAAWVWSLRSNDATPLLEASRSRRQPCAGCDTLAEELERRERQGWHVALEGIDVQRTRLRRDGDVVVATSRVDIPESASLHEDGSFRSTNPAHEDATFTVTLRPGPKRHVLVSFTVG